MAYSYTKYTGDGSNRNFVVTFPYLHREHVQVRVDNRAVNFSFVNQYTIQTQTAPPVGSLVYLIRITPRDELLVEFQDGSTLKDADLNRMSLQNLYIAQEAYDGLDGETAQAAMEQARDYLEEVIELYNDILQETFNYRSWLGTQSEYFELESYHPEKLYFIKETVPDPGVEVWMGTQQEYENLTYYHNNILYLITDQS